MKCCQIIRQINHPRLAISKGGTAKPRKCSDLSCKTLEFDFKIRCDTPKPEFGRDLGCGRGRALHLSATPNLANLRPVIKVCRESPAKLSQGMRLRGGPVEFGQYEVRGGEGSFPKRTIYQTRRQGREGFFKKLEDGKEKMKEKSWAALLYEGNFWRSNVQTFLPMYLRRYKGKNCNNFFSQDFCCFGSAKVKYIQFDVLTSHLSQVLFWLGLWQEEALPLCWRGWQDCSKSLCCILMIPFMFQLMNVSVCVHSQ